MIEGASIYDDLLDLACLMAFPGTGVLSATDVLDSLKQAPRWASVDMTGRSIGRASEAVIVLGYTAEGKRDGAQPYRCFCTSTYRPDGQRWKLCNVSRPSPIDNVPFIASPRSVMGATF